MYNIPRQLKFLLLLCALLPAYDGHSQQALEQYMQEGLANNLFLKNKNQTLSQSLISLKKAKSWFLPSVDFAAGYNLAQGGRTIDLPLGDLLNSTYSTLNSLTESQNFPQLENTQVQFLPNDFYDARLRVSYPLLNPSIYYNKSISEQAVKLEEYEVEIYKTELTRDIKDAYYNYCMAEEAIAIFKNGLELVERNLAVNQSLLDNGKGLYAHLMRAESEVENVKTSLLEAVKSRDNAKYYFNFLLNRDAETEIISEAADPALLVEVMQELSDYSNRSEMKKINAAMGIKELQLRSDKSYFIPRISTFVDLGSQGFDFDVNSQSRYYLFGIQLTMPIFEGNRNRLNIQQRALEMESLANNKQLLSQQLAMSAKIALNNYTTDVARLESAKKNLKSARAYFKLVEKGYGEGTQTHLEFLDARNQLTNAEIQTSISEYAVLKSIASLEREFTISKIQ